MIPNRRFCPTVILPRSIAIFRVKCFWRVVLICPGLIFIGCEGTTLGRAIASTETVPVRSNSIAPESNAKAPADDLAVQTTRQSPLAKPPYSLKASDLGAAFAFDRSTIIPRHEISQTDTQPPQQLESSPPDKRQYSLLNPTPRELWRDLTTRSPGSN